MNDIPLTIKEIQEGLLKKDFSAVNLVDAYLKRMLSMFQICLINLQKFAEKTHLIVLEFTLS